MKTIFYTIVNLFLRPLSFIHLKYLYLSGNAFYATIYLKSGNKFTIFCREFKIEASSVGGDYTKVSWQCYEYHDMLTIDPSQIESVTIRR